MAAAWRPPPEPPPPPGTAGAYSIPPPPPSRERKWLPVVALFVALLFVVFGGYFVAVGAGVTTPSGQAPRPTTVTVGDIRFRPAPGWTIARRISGAQPAVILTRGIGNLLVLANSNAPDAGSALDAYLDDVLTPEATELQVSDVTEEVPLPGGIAALRRAYVGRFVDNPATLEGEVTAFVLATGEVVVFDGWAQEDSYRLFVEEVDAMAGTSERR